MENCFCFAGQGLAELDVLACRDQRCKDFAAILQGVVTI
jgi:hypothetical protein